jgi:hypothetical protein
MGLVPRRLLGVQESDPDGLLSLDPQLICYSLLVFIRKHLPEIQYLKTTISEEQT